MVLARFIHGVQRTQRKCGVAMRPHRAAGPMGQGMHTGRAQHQKNKASSTERGLRASTWVAKRRCWVQGRASAAAGSSVKCRGTVTKQTLLGLQRNDTCISLGPVSLQHFSCLHSTLSSAPGKARTHRAHRHTQEPTGTHTLTHWCTKELQTHSRTHTQIRVQACTLSCMHARTCSECTYKHKRMRMRHACTLAHTSTPWEQAWCRSQPRPRRPQRQQCHSPPALQTS